MIPAVPVPKTAKIKVPLEVKLREDCWFDPGKRVFRSNSGAEFSPRGKLPKKSRIVHKIPSLAQADPTGLTKDERELRRYVQVILPGKESPAQYVKEIRTWPCVERVYVGPEVSLP
jgi:hypothetical protein